MSALTLTLKDPPDQRVNMSPLVPHRLQRKSLEEIRNIRLTGSRQDLTVGKLFNVSGAQTEHIRMLSGSPMLDAIGSEMTQGLIEVKGGAGDCLGLGMRGGEIRVDGGVRRWAASGMKGGRIHIMGDAGDFLGGALPGSPMGMEDGMVVVSGNAGDRVGDRMRRGILVVEGNAGDYCGSRLLAGTIIILGQAGVAVGFAMKRGSIILAAPPTRIASTFNSCGHLKMEFLRVLFRHLSRSQRRFEAFNAFGPEAERYAGDLAYGGKGEILILDNTLTGTDS